MAIFVENDKAMSDIEKIQLFENKKIRTAWDEEKQEWYFSIVDIRGILTEQPDYDGARKYWKVLKGRLIAEGFELVSNCYQLKMVSPKDGKKYSTDVTDMQQAFRIIQSIPSSGFGSISIILISITSNSRQLRERRALTVLS